MSRVGRFVPRVPLLLRHPWVPGARLVLDARRHLTYWKRGLRRYEPHVAQLLNARVRPGWTVYEVGTHVGFFTLQLSHLARRVVGIEADLGNLGRTAMNLSRNRVENATLLGAALSSTSGSSGFVRDDETGAAGGIEAFHHGAHAGPLVQVPTLRLDAVAETLGAPDFVKIDVEGAEDEVLLGMGSLLDRDVRLLVEVGEETRRPVQDRLRAHGFKLLNPHTGMSEQRPGTYAGWHIYAHRA